MEIVELLPELCMLRFPIGHVYLWRDPAGLTLVDTGVAGSGPRIAEAIERLGHRPGEVRRVLLTHFHDDHVGSAADIAGWGDVSVYAHRADAPVIRGEAEGPPPVLADWEQRLLAKVSRQLPPGPPAPVHVQDLDEADVLDLGSGVRAVCVAVPGHTPGSVAFHLPEARVLFTGDTIARGPDGTVMLGVFNVDPVLAATSFRRQARLDVDIACFGHGEPLTENAGDSLRAAAQQLTDASPAEL